MGRPRAFDTDTVLAAAVDVFTTRGYSAASVDEILAATQIRRASLYNAFGSKRGLFLAALRSPASTMDLLLVALLELAPDDETVRDEIGAMLAAQQIDDRALGAALLRRAGLERSETT
ncbi:TetR/AcrR family transcriptional regulator [Gordonia soli]|uniref:Putative TetR family transcriptional regulator n=1 Tax=Gordonia soli NBRC 108243 TaxID=1223545 RepID=M0QLJ2_9ACTN|nr:TetR/AcrR family transcriptional regulator [Gordonia soli]GAC68272.1 putative TetR family transcriptional regulator [Gordonia soli NBRC 108243]